MRVFGMFPVSSVRVARPVHPQRGIGEPASARPSLRGYGTIGSKAHWLGPALSSGTYAVPQDCEANRRRAVEPAGTLQHARARMNGLPSFPIVRSRSLEEGYLAERFALRAGSSQPGLRLFRLSDNAFAPPMVTRSRPAEVAITPRLPRLSSWAGTRGFPARHIALRCCQHPTFLKSHRQVTKRSGASDRLLVYLNWYEHSRHRATQTCTGSPNRTQG